VFLIGTQKNEAIQLYRKHNVTSLT